MAQEPEFEEPSPVRLEEEARTRVNTSTGWQAVAMNPRGDLQFHDHNNSVAAILYREKTCDVIIQLTGRLRFAWDVSIKTDLMYGRWFDEDTPENPTEIILNLARARWEKFPVIKMHSIPLGRGPDGKAILAVLGEDRKRITVVRDVFPGTEFCMAMVYAQRQHPRQKLRTYMPYYLLEAQEAGTHTEAGAKVPIETPSGSTLETVQEQGNEEEGNENEEGNAEGDGESKGSDEVRDEVRTRETEYDDTVDVRPSRVLTMYPVLVAASVNLRVDQNDDVYVPSEAKFYNDMPLVAR